MKKRRIETRESRWWARLDALVSRWGLSDEQRDELLELIIDAVHEDKAAELGSLGGLKGGHARAAALTAKQRSLSASQAANARWSKS